MKGAIIGYTAIIAILIVSVLSIYYSTLSTSSSKEVTTKEGLLVSSEDFNFFLLKTLNQSIEFIAQRAAYDLALNGGFIEGREVFWNFYYPQMSDLEKNLANRIGSNLPSSYKKFDRTVVLENTKIIIENEQLQYFDVGGYTNISIYDETVRSKTFSNFNVNSRAVSSYFRLLWAAREILENETFNSSLNDANALTLKLRAETLPAGRFNGLDFEITSSSDILDITIEDRCYTPDTYCLAPLNPNEPKTKRDINTSQLIPYENLKLRFRIKVEQTGSTPSSCKFSIILNPVMGSVLAGYEADVPLSVINLGTTSDVVTLNAKAYNKTTMTEDYTITVTFDDNSKPMSYNTIMRIKTGSFTLSGGYLINVTGDGCSPNQENFATYDLTVNPAMTFSISVDTDPVKLINNMGLYSNSTNVFVNILTGIPEDVLLSVTDLPLGVGRSLSQNGMPPNFASVLTLTTDGNTPQLDYTITIKGIGGGSYVEKRFTLHVEEPFDFHFYIQGIGHDEIFRTITSTTHLAVETTAGTPETVDFSYDVVNSSGLTDPSNYGITVQIIPKPCPLTPLIPNCYPTMNIFTNLNTPADTYTIHVNAIATHVSHQTSFDLTVKNPECYDTASAESTDCIASKGPAVPCKYYTCVGLGCVLNNRGKVVPPSDGCGPASCSGFCDATSEMEYSNPPSPTYSIVCDGAGSCNMTFDPSRCNYGSVKTCRYGCKDNTNCFSGKYCEPGASRCKIGGTGHCGDQVALYEGGCFDESDTIPTVLATTTCVFGVWSGTAAVVYDCANCPEGLETNCPGESYGCGISGCTLSSCSINDKCTYSSKCGDGVCEFEEDSSSCPSDCTCSYNCIRCSGYEVNNWGQDICTTDEASCTRWCSVECGAGTCGPGDHFDWGACGCVPNSGCLEEGSLILTPVGFKRIENLKVGDVVIGYKDGKRVETKVLNTSVHEGKFELYYYKGYWFTGNHKVYTDEFYKEFKPVSEISNFIKYYARKIYNIQTEVHNYFGENDLLIHNK
jgi:hypothetical protein